MTIYPINKTESKPPPPLAVPHLGGKYGPRSDHPNYIPGHYKLHYYPMQVVDGPYDSFEGVDEEEQAIWSTKWVVRYNDGNVLLLAEEHFTRHMVEMEAGDVT